MCRSPFHDDCGKTGLRVGIWPGDDRWLDDVASPTDRGRHRSYSGVADIRSLPVSHSSRSAQRRIALNRADVASRSPRSGDVPLAPSLDQDGSTSAITPGTSGERAETNYPFRVVEAVVRTENGRHPGTRYRRFASTAAR